MLIPFYGVDYGKAEVKALLLPVPIAWLNSPPEGQARLAAGDSGWLHASRHRLLVPCSPAVSMPGLRAPAGTPPSRHVGARCVFWVEFHKVIGTTHSYAVFPSSIEKKSSNICQRPSQSKSVPVPVMPLLSLLLGLSGTVSSFTS